MRSRNIVESFNYAIEGIIYAVKTQRNIKVHLIMAMLAMILAVVLNVTRVELLILMLTIGGDQHRVDQHRHRRSGQPRS